MTETGPRRLFVGIASAVGSVLLVGPLSSANALELTWSTGLADRALVSAQSCTLLVKATPGSTLPDHWLLNWAANLDVAAALRVQPSSAIPLVADVCSVPDAYSIESRAAHRTIVQH